MSPDFARAVDPVFLSVLRAWERIEQHADVSPSALQNQLLRGIEDADDRLRDTSYSEAWQLARYAICAWIDDLLTHRTWKGAQWWENNKLEFQFFKSNDAGTMFFQKAQEAQRITNRDAIEVFYIAVVLGFKGLYGVNDSKYAAQSYDLPPTREEWARRAASMLSVRPTRRPVAGTPIAAAGAPPLDSRLTLVGAALCLLMLTVMAVFLGVWILYYQA